MIWCWLAWATIMWIGGALWLDGLNLAGSYTSYNRFLEDYYNAARDVRLNVHKRADGSQTLLIARQEAETDCPR